MRRRTVPRAPFSSTLPLALLVLVAGCSQDLVVSPAETTDPNAFARAFVAAKSPDRGFFPLTIGNRWHAVAEARSRVFPSDGGPVIDEFSVHTDISRELIGTELVFDRSYVLMEETLMETVGSEPPSPHTAWTRYRQDGKGLYEADVSGPPESRMAEASRAASLDSRRARAREFPASLRSRLPANQVASYERAWAQLHAKAELVRGMLAARATGERSTGPLSGEIQRLEYPMHPGAEWTVRENPLFTSEVEGVDHLNLAAGRFQAYRIRIQSELFREGDLAHVWFGRAGQLQARYHLTGVATDDDGNEIGLFEYDYEEAVDQVTLAN